jgi:alpha 1,2-mannosyltransferase
MTTAVSLGELHRKQQQAVIDFMREPHDFSGRGIVTTAYDREFPSVWVLLSELARLKVPLPVQAFHTSGELSARNAALLRSLDLDLTLRVLPDNALGFAIKPFAIYRSSFREVLWLDCDNFPVRDPSFLFDDAEYRAKGSLFWRDVSGVDHSVIWHPLAKVWGMFHVPPNDAEEFESGQLLVDKQRCWPELGLTLHFAANMRVYGEAVYGDKDMFRMAWQNLAAGRQKAPNGHRYLADPAKVPYGFMPYGPFHMGRPNPVHKWGGGTVMVQRDRDGLALFVHRNLDKFSLAGDNPFNADVPNEAVHHEHLRRLRALVAEPMLTAQAGR